MVCTRSMLKALPLGGSLEGNQKTNKRTSSEFDDDTTEEEKKKQSALKESTV